MEALKDDHQQSTMEEKSGPKMARSSSSGPLSSRSGKSKGDSRYWTEPGRLKFHDSPEYSARIQAGGKRTWFPLGSANKKTAAAKAAEIYSFIQANGLEAALERYKPKAAEEGKNDATVGKLIDTARHISSARTQSLDAYTKAFRRIVAEIKGITDDRKHDHHGGGALAWQARVDAVKLESLTPAEVVAWKNRRLRDAEADPLAKKRATVTVNSLIRNSKALFGKKILPFIEQTITLPRPLPFDGVTLEKPPSMRYVSKMDPFALLALAKEEMGETAPEAFKVMVLALVCGLRRSEIDNLLWRAFDFPNSKLRVETSEFHELKSEDSAGEIDLDADTLALFRGYRAKDPTATFVIATTKKKRVSKKPTTKKARTYRCDPVFMVVLEWLRKHGVEASKPLHTLRKEIGSIIASEHGIFEASRYLRHSDIRITSAIYADKKKTVTPKTFAGLLGNPAAVEDGDFGGAGETARKSNG
jgi:integrase